jgi:hypothetical protein
VGQTDDAGHGGVVERGVRRAHDQRAERVGAEDDGRGQRGGDGEDGHFADGRDGIIRAVALAGFARLAELLTAAADLGGICAAYLDFARSQPATYEAMFSMPTDLEFARPTTPEPLRAGFGPLLSTMGDETRAEILWSALHGLADLSRHGRLRPGHETARVEALIGLARRGHLRQQLEDGPDRERPRPER